MADDRRLFLKCDRWHEHEVTHEIHSLEEEGLELVVASIANNTHSIGGDGTENGEGGKEGVSANDNTIVDT
jgi:hypothetical protein